MRHTTARLWVATCLVGCSGPQSALAPAGRAAREIATLFWWMAGSSLLVWLIVLALTLYAARTAPEANTRRHAGTLIVWGGALVPTVLLVALLVYGLRMLPPLLAEPPSTMGKVHVMGEQWWWRVRYDLPDGTSFDLANELRVPVGHDIPLSLSARDVIHSFWVPALAGKVDMIPGRRTRLALHAERAGTYLGVCAEFCGSAHAQMRMHVVALEPAAYSRWLVQQAAPAQAAEGTIAVDGARVFERVGCGACHTVRGTGARGLLGPDLTHVGSRKGVAAALLDNDPAGFARWLRHAEQLKPGVHMPSYRMLSQTELSALSAYLDGLQ